MKITANIEPLDPLKKQTKQKTRESLICGKCPRKFTWRNNLLIHRKTHSGIKNFTCEICGHRSLLHAHLKAHIKTVHNKLTNKNSPNYQTNILPNHKLNKEKPNIQKPKGKNPKYIVSLLLNQDVTKKKNNPKTKQQRKRKTTLKKENTKRTQFHTNPPKATCQPIKNNTKPITPLENFQSAFGKTKNTLQIEKAWTIPTDYILPHTNQEIWNNFCTYHGANNDNYYSPLEEDADILNWISQL